MKKRRLISDMAVMILLIIMSSLLEHRFAECTGSYICFYHDRNSETPAITINKLIEWQDKYSLKNIAFTSECCECTIKDMTVTPVLTNEYITNTELKLIHGSGITADDIANKNAVIIISEHLALSLFMTKDGIGRSIYMDNEEYTVCGVYSKPDNVLDRLCSDGKERVYIPYTSGGHKGFTNVDTISCSSGSVEAKRLLQMQMPQYFEVDFCDKQLVLRTLRSMAFVAALFLMFIIISEICNTLHREYRKNRHGSTRRAALAKLLHDSTTDCILAALLCASAVIILICRNITFYIVPEFIPEEYIFDARFYVNKIIETVQLENTMQICGAQDKLELYRTTFRSMVEIVIIESIIIAKIINVMVYHKIRSTAF